MYTPQQTLNQAVDRASEITWWNRSLTKLDRFPQFDNGVEFAENDLIERKGPYVELVNAPQAHDQSAATFLGSLDYDPAIIDGVTEALFDGDRSGTLYEHQAQTIEAIETTDKDTILSVPTATGKTESFFFPILNHCLATDEPGLKSLVIYPMKTLSVDQMNRFLTYLDHINRNKPPENRITVGIWDGDTPHDVGSRDYEVEIGSYIRGLECPRTGKKLKVQSSTSVGTAETDYSWVRVTRESIKQGADILLTNPEALDYMMVNDSQETRSILGDRPGEHPLKHIVYDEAHIWSGVSGAAISLLTRRLKHFYAENDPQITMVSATVDNPAELASSLTGTPEDQVNDIGFTARDLSSPGSVSFNRLQPTDLSTLTRILAITHYETVSRRDLEERDAELLPAVDTLEAVGLIVENENLQIHPQRADWVVNPIETAVDRLLDDEYETEYDVYTSDHGIDVLQDAIVSAGGSDSAWYDFVTTHVAEVATLADWFETDTTGSVGFKNYDELIKKLAERSVDDAEGVLQTVMMFGRLAGIVTEKYHNFLKPPNKAFWCEDCRRVTQASACPDCGRELPEAQFCRRCHYPYIAIDIESEDDTTDDEDTTAFAPIDHPTPIDDCPGCGRYVNTGDIGVPTSTLLSFMLTEICRTTPSEKTLVFSDSHAAAESVAEEIINTEYGLMAETLYIKHLLENDGVSDSYEAFQQVSQTLQEEYWDPLFENEADQDGESYDILQQYKNEITSNALLNNCTHLLRSALVAPEPLFQAAEQQDDTAYLVVGYELYRLFAQNPRIDFQKHGAHIQGLTLEKLYDRIESRTHYDRRTVQTYVDKTLPVLMDDDVIVERTWDDVSQDISESSADNDDTVFKYIENQRDAANENPALDEAVGDSFDSGVFTRVPKRDQSDIRLLPRVSYCTECYSSYPLPTGGTTDRCHNCDDAVETYDRFTIEPDGTYSGQGYADIGGEWEWPLDHWAYETAGPLTDGDEPDYVTVGIHKSNIPPTLRGATEEGFRKDDPEINIVSATPTMELGVDIGNLDTITQVGMPPTLTNYVQRSGRTGRERGSSSLVLTVIRGEHPVDNHYYANLDGFFREFEPVRVPDAYQFDEVLAGHVMTATIGYLARNPHQPNVFDQIYKLPESATDLESYVSKIEERFEILREFVRDAMWDELTTYIEDVFGPEGVAMLEEIFADSGILSIPHRVDRTFSQLATMAGSTETNKRLTEQHNRLDSWLSLLGYLANYRDFGERFPVKFSGRYDSIEFESEGRLYDMFPGPENGRGSTVTLQGTQYLVDDVHGTTTPLSEIAVCANDECDQAFEPYDPGVDICPHCGEELESTDVHGISSVECRVARGGEQGYTTRGIISTHVSADDSAAVMEIEERELFDLPCTIESGQFEVTDFVYAFERGHTQSPTRETLRSEALIERDESSDTSDLSWQERLNDVSEETYAPVGQNHYTNGLKLSFPREAVAARLEGALPSLQAETVDELWPQLLSSFKQAVTKAVAVVAGADEQDFRVKTTLRPDSIELYIVDSRQGGNGITWQVERDLDSGLLNRIVEVVSCARCADYCEECLLLARTPPKYLENDLLNKHTVRAFLGTTT